MSFSADWLTTRRAADRRARNPKLAEKLASHFEGRAEVRILDLGCGTGANLAETSLLLGAAQRWVLVDNDPALLARVPEIPGIQIRTVEADLHRDLETLLSDPYDLVTASALFDLAGAALLDRLIEQVTQARAAFYTVLTYDGHETWHPKHSLDASVLSAFHADQHTDKGLGPALGPDATQHLREGFDRAGYDIATAPSNWDLEQARDGDLIGMLASGIHDATVSRIGKSAEDWFNDRQTAARVEIGHQDLLALPR